MGGVVSVQIHRRGGRRSVLERAAERVLDRIEAWAGRLTRFSPDSELMRLNAAPASLVPIGPTLTAVLDWARMAEGMTDGLVDASLLDERLAAEAGLDPASCPSPPGRRWSLRRTARGAVVRARAGRPVRPRRRRQGLARRPRARDHPRPLRAGRRRRRRRAPRSRPATSWVVGVADPARARHAARRRCDLGADGDVTRDAGGSRPPAPASTAGRTRAATPTTSSTRGRGGPPRRTSSRRRCWPARRARRRPSPRRP